jgi:D-ribose pyranase
MKKSGILNIEISRIIASMGHGDCIAISDAGLPVPHSVPLVDVSIAKNIPKFIDVLKSVLLELKVEKVIIAEELEINSPKVYESIKRLMPDVEIETIRHKDFKERINRVKAVIRTGEFSSYSNIILLSGVVF